MHGRRGHGADTTGERGASASCPSEREMMAPRRALISWRARAAAPVPQPEEEEHAYPWCGILGGRGATVRLSGRCFPQGAQARFLLRVDDDGPGLRFGSCHHAATSKARFLRRAFQWIARATEPCPVHAGGESSLLACDVSGRARREERDPAELIIAALGIAPAEEIGDIDAESHLRIRASIALGWATGSRTVADATGTTARRRDADILCGDASPAGAAFAHEPLTTVAIQGALGRRRGSPGGRGYACGRDQATSTHLQDAVTHWDLHVRKPRRDIRGEVAWGTCCNACAARKPSIRRRSAANEDCAAPSWRDMHVTLDRPAVGQEPRRTCGERGTLRGLRWARKHERLR